MNRAYCNTCESLVPATPEEREGRVFLVKDCPSCGKTETLISGNAGRYASKRALDEGYDYQVCKLDCMECRHRKKPNFLFVDITNRCNLNCPICINNTPSMGFLFEPPMEYFDAIFKELSQENPPPAVQLFGGEPTMRGDLFEIIALAKSYGLPTRVVTNGLKLADEDYCRRLVATRATILIAFDGNNPDTYRVLRASEKALDLKLAALENIRKVGGAKVAVMMCVAKGFNDHEFGPLLEFLHERRDFVRGVYFMPLSHVWDPSRFALTPERMTSEDVEAAVDACFPDVQTEFIPAGVFGQTATVMEHLGIKPPPFMGAHPNCESIYLLVSNGQRYVPLDYYMKSSLRDMIEHMCALDKKLAARAHALETGISGRLLGAIGLKRPYLSLRAMLAVARCVVRHSRSSRTLKGRWVGKAWHGAAVLGGLLIGRKTRTLLERHTNIHEIFQLIVLPFEDKFVLETDRLERCPNAFAFLDPDSGKVKTVPVCAWGQHKKAVFRHIAEFYAAPKAASA